MELKFGLMAVKKPIEDMFATAKESKISHIEIDLIKDHSLVETFDIKRISNLKKLATKYGITISLHTPYTINPSDKINLIQKANKEYLKRCIILASKINATHITTHIGYCNGLPTWTHVRQEALERLVIVFKELIPLCKKYKVCLALENVNPMPKDSEFFYLGDNIQDLDYIFKKVKSQFLKLCLDTGHANTNEGPIKYIKHFSKKIISIHYHDNKGKYDEHLAIGEGIINWESFAKEIENIKFKGPFVSEVFSKSPARSKEMLDAYF